MELAAGLEQRLGPEDVGSARKRPVGESHGVARHHLRDPVRDRSLSLRREAPPFVLASDAVAAEVDDGGTGEHAQDLGVHPRQLTDRAQLAARRRDGAVVLAVERGRALQRGARGLRIAAEQVCLRLGGGGVVGLLATGCEELEHGRGEPSRGRRVT